MSAASLVDAVVTARAASDRARAADVDSVLDDILTAREAAFRKERSEFEPIDPFLIFGRDADELTHSRVLRWLLDERGSHGLGRTFAAAFVHRLGSELPKDRYTTAVEVRGLESSIDVVLEGPGILVGIENKVFSKERDDQTPRELRDLQRIARGRPVVLAYLTPSGQPARERRAVAVAWSVVAELLEHVLVHAPAGARPWLEGVRFHIDRLFERGGSAMRTEFREDVKVLLARWRDYREVVDTFARAAEDLNGIHHAVAVRVLRKPWAGVGWERRVQDGAVLVRRHAWGDDEDGVRLCVQTWGFESMLGESKDVWWSGIQVKGVRLDQPTLSEMLLDQARRDGDAAAWQFQPQSDDGCVMWHALPPLTPAELAEGKILETAEREFDSLARFVPTVDAFVARSAPLR